MANDLTSPDNSNRNATMLGVRAIQEIVTAIKSVFPSATGGVATTASTGSATLPGNPAGFFVVSNPTTGQTVKVPFYND